MNLPKPIGNLKDDIDILGLRVREKMTRGVTTHPNTELLRLFAPPGGAVSMVWEMDSAYDSAADAHPEWIVGTYSRSATRQQICADLRAMRKALGIREARRTIGADLP